MSCPICQKPPVDSYRPFCSKRCAELDLAKWFSGAYTIPVDGADEGDLSQAMSQDTEPRQQ